MSRFASNLLKWYRANKRSLPWRGHADPYAVWVSEIMLQQTRVETVVPYFLRWMRTFPTIRRLARASERQVLNQWEGLGYYARARNLRRAAQLLVKRFGGELPGDVESLRTLPGIGRYTAGAIASMAFGQDEAALDGNIRRVLARVFNVSEAANSPAGEMILWELATRNLPKGHAGDYNQAMMDLGATICVPTKPRCPICPVRGVCEALKLGIQEERPVLKAKKTVPHHVYVAAVILRKGRVLLVRRPSNGLLGGMWEFPNGKVQGSLLRGLEKTIRRLYALDLRLSEPLGVVRHGYSHFTAEVHVFACELKAEFDNADSHWVTVKKLDEYPMGKIDRQIAELIHPIH
jgi:A/G-specific adenine glycosylase